jgi:hypothetical protein
MDVHIDSTWCDEKQCFWRGFEVSKNESLFSAMSISESASQDGLNWGINGTIASQIGRELGLPYSYDVVKGFSRLGYYDLMDFAGANAGNGFFPSLPNAWMRGVRKGWVRVDEVSPRMNEKITVEICAAGYAGCAATDAQIVKIPINGNEYILLENRQRAHRADGKIRVKMDNGASVEIPADSLQQYFLADGKHSEIKGIIESIDAPDAALPASGIAAWHVNDWYADSLVPYGAINAWGGDTFRDHQFGISLIEASGVLLLGKEFRGASGESAYYFGSGSDLLPHKKFNDKNSHDVVSSINPSGYANTASAFGGYSGIKITALPPEGAAQERTMNPLTGDSVITWRALKIPVIIERVSRYAVLLSKDEWPDVSMEEMNRGFEDSNVKDSTRIQVGSDFIFLGNNKLHAVDANGVPLPNFPAQLSNGEPLADFHSKPLPLDIDGDGSLEILVPANNGLLLAVNIKGKLLRDEFPLAAGTFVYEDTVTKIKYPMHLYLHKRSQSDSIFLFARHRDNISAFYLPKAKMLEAAQLGGSDIKEEFFIFPNPVRAGRAAMRFRAKAPASEATLDIFDITGTKVFSEKFQTNNQSSYQSGNLDLSKLGSDVYSARLSIKFADGAKNVKWVRIAVIK